MARILLRPHVALALIGLLGDGVLALLGIVTLVAVILVVMTIRETGKKRTPLEIPQGDHLVTVYVYDARPISRMRPGDRFRVTFANGTTTMDSVNSGTHWEGECGIIANGKQVGFMGDYDIRFSYVSQLTRTYRPVTAWAQIESWTSAGWPRMSLEMPEQQWFIEKAKEGR